jgi:hypothetical protein
MIVIASCNKKFKIKYNFTNAYERNTSMNMCQEVIILFKVWPCVKYTSRYFEHGSSGL